jgi:hypothetical protein
MIDFPRESLIKEFGSIPELALESKPPERVMRRIAPTTPEIRPVLSPATNLTSATSETQYVLSSKVFATGLLRATGSNLSVLEWELPATVKVHEVRSPGLAGWSRQGSRLQLWWSQPRSDHTIRWQGMHSIDLPMGDAIARVPIPLSLPTVRWTTPPHLGIDSQIVRLKAEPAWLVDPLPSGPRVKPRPESTLDLPCFSIEGNLNTSVRFQIVRYFPPAEAARTETPRPQPSNPVVAPPKAENLPATVPLVPEPTEELGRDRITKISLWLIAVAISALVSHRLNPGWKPELIVLWCALLIPLLSPASPAMLVFLVILAGAVLVRLVRIVRYLVVVGFPHFAR